MCTYVEKHVLSCIKCLHRKKKPYINLLKKKISCRRSRSYMYLSSDSLRTRMSLIRSILHSSPSMFPMVIVESAMEMTSSAGRQARPKHGYLVGSLCDGCWKRVTQTPQDQKSTFRIHRLNVNLIWNWGWQFPPPAFLSGPLSHHEGHESCPCFCCNDVWKWHFLRRFGKYSWQCQMRRLMQLVAG